MCIDHVHGPFRAALLISCFFRSSKDRDSEKALARALDELGYHDQVEMGGGWHAWILMS